MVRAGVLKTWGIQPRNDVGRGSTCRLQWTIHQLLLAEVLESPRLAGRGRYNWAGSNLLFRHAVRARSVDGAEAVLEDDECRNLLVKSASERESRDGRAGMSRSVVCASGPASGIAARTSAPATAMPVTSAVIKASVCLVLLCQRVIRGECAACGCKPGRSDPLSGSCSAKRSEDMTHAAAGCSASRKSVSARIITARVVQSGTHIRQTGWTQRKPS